MRHKLERMRRRYECVCAFACDRYMTRTRTFLWFGIFAKIFLLINREFPKRISPNGWRRSPSCIAIDTRRLRVLFVFFIFPGSEPPRVFTFFFLAYQTLFSCIFRGSKTPECSTKLVCVCYNLNMFVYLQKQSKNKVGQVKDSVERRCASTGRWKKLSLIHFWLARLR